MKVQLKSFKSLKESVVDSDPIYHEMFEKYVPSVGKANTVLGEIIRAVSRIGYRWYNDGDQFNEGYGVETAGSSAIYLMSHQPVGSLSTIVAKEGDTLIHYDEFVRHLEQALLDLLHDESKVKELSSQSNSIDSVIDFTNEAKRMFPEDEEDEDW